jgi:hypothetical protein
MHYRELNARQSTTAGKPDKEEPHRDQVPFSSTSIDQGPAEWRHEYTPSQTYSDQMREAYQVSRE